MMLISMSLLETDHQLSLTDDDYNTTSSSETERPQKWISSNK